MTARPVFRLTAASPRTAAGEGTGDQQSEPLADVWHVVSVAWEWVAPTGTVIVALAGIGATLRTAAQGRDHAERLATENYGQAHEEMLRRERLKVYASALAHALDQERKLNASWAVSGDRAFDLSPKPPGGPLSLAPMDDVTVQMRLLAEEEVEEAWMAFVSAWDEFHWWAANEHSGDPQETAPEELEVPLRTAINGLKDACRRSLRL